MFDYFLKVLEYLMNEFGMIIAVGISSFFLSIIAYGALALLPFIPSYFIFGAIGAPIGCMLGALIVKFLFG
jgi:hypothetical protein